MPSARRSRRRMSTRSRLISPRTTASRHRNELGVAELDAPVAAVAEGLVRGGTATTKRVVLARSAVAELHAHELDAARHGVGAVAGHQHLRRPRGRRRFLAVDCIAQRAGGAFVNRGDDLIDRRAVGINPRLGARAEYFLQPIRAKTGMRADRAFIEDGDAPAAIALAPVVRAVRRPAVGKANRAVRAIAEGLVLRAAATA